MDDTHPAVELRVLSRSFRWDPGLFFIVLLGLISLGFFLVDAYQVMPGARDGEDNSAEFEAHILFAVVNVVLTLGALLVWLNISYVANRSKVNIENDRISGTVYNGNDNQVNLDIGAIHTIEVEEDGNGRTVSLLIEHKDGAVALVGFSNLESALDTIRDRHPGGVTILPKRPIALDAKIVIAFVVIAASLATLIPIYVRFLAFEGITDFIVAYLCALRIKLDLLILIIEQKRRIRKFKAFAILNVVSIALHLILALLVCVVVT